MIPEAGQRLGPYEILGRLGGGGMGLVFRAWDERLHREVAIKLLHDDYKMSAMRQRFLQEARAASALNHPNICTVFDIGEQNGDPYLVMELLEGETLKDRIGRGALSVEEIVRYAGEIADALTVAHAKGIVHRDIKPANIFLVPMPNGKSQAKVLDFGLAKIGLEVHGGWRSRTLDLTLAGATVGTLAYMSPEQARGESLDMRSDLFSLGVVLYEMATRQAPFRGATSAIVFVQLFNHSPEPVRNWNESIPRGLERLILKLLAKDRKARFQTAKEFHAELMRIEKKVGRGSWPQNGAATVPLVRAADPVARRRPQKQRTEQDRTGMSDRSGEMGAATSSSGAARMLVHPRHVPDGADPAVSQQMSAAVTENGNGQKSLQTASEFAADNIQMDLQDAFMTEGVAQHTGRAVVVALQEREPVLLRSRSGMTQFEYESGEEEDAGFSTSLITGARPRSAFEGAEALSEVETGARSGLVVSLVLAAVVVAGVFLLARSGVFRPVVIRANDRLLLTDIEDKTSDKSLGGATMEGLEIELRQSETLNLLGTDAFRAGQREIEAEGGGTGATEQRVAQRVGAKAYLHGEITGPDAPYTIEIDVMKTDSNNRVASLQETVASRAEIPAALGRLAQAVRFGVSEDSKAEARRGVPLESEATTNVTALNDYAMGEAAMEDGHQDDALRDFQMAASLDPKFVQAQMRLAWLYRSEKAEVAAAKAAELAKTAAADASDKVKLLTQFTYDVNANGDYPHAVETIRLFVSRYPQDVDGMNGLALVLRLEGYLPESLLAAQQGYGENSYDAETYLEAEEAMIGMDRFDGALQLEMQAKKQGLLVGSNALTAESLDGKEELVAKQVSTLQAEMAGEKSAGDGQATLAALDSYGRYLDSGGLSTEGLVLWKTAAGRALSVSGLESARASMLAQGALDRAMEESCTVALDLVSEVKTLPKGPLASFNAGAAAALCGDQTYAEKAIAEMRDEFPQNSAVTQYYVPELHAAAEIGVNHPGSALQYLMTVEQYDHISLAPYLRGLAHAALGQTPEAVNDFEQVLSQRGTSLSLAGAMYPMAEIGLARAYAASGDKADSVTYYQRFMALWVKGDKAQPLMAEALVRSR
jgi:eukaryotic-like serine/threonine-protein kinase